MYNMDNMYKMGRLVNIDEMNTIFTLWTEDGQYGRDFETFDGKYREGGETGRKIDKIDTILANWTQHGHNVHSMDNMDTLCAICTRLSSFEYSTSQKIIRIFYRLLAQVED